MKTLSLTLLAFLLSMAVVEPALAYVGPGAGLSVLGALWALLLAVLSAVGYVILWPLRRMRRRRRQAREAGQARENAAETNAERRGQAHDSGDASSSGSRPQ